MQIDLQGRVALVTGASRGIGRAIALGLGGAGASVAVHYWTGPGRAVAEELGAGARAFQADLSDFSACASLFEQVLGHFGAVDILVNNAGIARMIPDQAGLGEWAPAWGETMAVNLGSVELLCRLAVKHMAPRGGGRIINVASRAAFRGDTPEYMTHAASKGGVVALTRTIARAYGKKGVAAFVIAPGFVRTDMAQDAIDAYGESFVVDDLALDRLTEPADLVPLVTVLASGLADHATGATVDINAGSYVH